MISLILAVALTMAQEHQIVRINQDVNSHMGRLMDGHGNCLPIAREKYRRLVSAGIPGEALSLHFVRAPVGWSDPYHALVHVDAAVNGRPWIVDLDMNDAWPLTSAQVSAYGYRELNAPLTADVP